TARTMQDDLNVHTQSWDGPKKRASFHVGIISTRSDANRGSSTPRGLAWICRADHSSAGHPRVADNATTVWSFSSHCCCHYPLCVSRRDPSGTTCTQTRRPIWHVGACVIDRYYRSYSYLGSDAGTRRPSNDCSRAGSGGGYDHYESGGWYRPACSRAASGFVTSQPIGCIRLHSDLISVAHCGVCLTAGGRCGRHLSSGSSTGRADTDYSAVCILFVPPNGRPA